MSWNFGLDFGSALGGFVGLLGANASTHKQYKYQSRLQEQAAKLNYEYGLKSLENSPTSQRKGLETAGYNPMLAVQNSTSGANSGWTTTGQMSAPDYSQAFSNALEMKRVENETAQTNSIVGLQGQQAETEASKRKNLEFQNSMLDVEKHLKQKDLDSYDKRFYTEMYQMMQNAEKLRQEASVVGYNAESARIVANAQKQNVNIGQEALDIGKDKELRYKEWGKKHPILRNLDETVNRYINLNFGGSASSGSSVSHIYKH